jgi:hypothetical protein
MIAAGDCFPHHLNSSFFPFRDCFHRLFDPIGDRDPLAEGPSLDKFDQEATFLLGRMAKL